MNKTEIEVYRQFARPHYDGRDAGHDFRHIERIISRLPSLSLGMNPVPYKLYFLACFHGLGECIRNDITFRNTVFSFLRDLNWEQTEIEESFDSLHTHLKDPQTPEEKIVHDANYVEVLGAFGIAKAFTTGGARGQTYEMTADIFETNLNQIVFRTPEGQRQGKEKMTYALDFLSKLRKELKYEFPNT